MLSCSIYQSLFCWHQTTDFDFLIFCFFQTTTDNPAVQRNLDDSDVVAQSSIISLHGRIDRYESDVEIQRNAFGGKLHNKSDDFLTPFVRVAKYDTEKALLRLAKQQQWLDEHVSAQQPLAAHRFRTVLQSGAIQPLPGVDLAGRACLLLSIRPLMALAAKEPIDFAALAVCKSVWCLRKRGD